MSKPSSGCPTLRVSVAFLVAVLYMGYLQGTVVPADEPVPEFTTVTESGNISEYYEFSFSGAPSTLYKIRWIQPNGQQYDDVDSYGTNGSGNHGPSQRQLPIVGNWKIQLWPGDADANDFATGTPLDYRDITVIEED